MENLLYKNSFLKSLRVAQNKVLKFKNLNFLI